MRRLGIAIILAAALFLAGFSAGRAATPRTAAIPDRGSDWHQLGAPSAGLAQPAEHPLKREVTGAEPVPGGESLGGASQFPPGPAAASAQPTAEPAPATPGTAASKPDTSDTQGPGRTGPASWYCLAGRSACTSGYPASGMYAAAGPALRVGAWRGRYVTVTANGHSVRVRLVDLCQCYDHRVIDLYSAAFARLAPLSAGVVRVTVRW